MTSLAVLAGYNGITEAEFQTLDVNGFYGPGSWAPWIITLFASWIAILRDDYTHNAHFIAYALYTNWAAMNIIQLLSVDWKFDKLYSDVEKSFYQVADTKLPFSFILNDLDDKFSLCAFSNTTSGTWEGIYLNANPDSVFWHCDWAEDEEHHASQVEHKMRLQTQLAAHTDTCIQLVSLWAQLTAAKAVLIVGVLCAFTQILVVMWKQYVHRTTSGGAPKGYLKRFSFLFLGLTFPTVVWVKLSQRELQVRFVDWKLIMTLGSITIGCMTVWLLDMWSIDRRLSRRVYVGFSFDLQTMEAVIMIYLCIIFYSSAFFGLTGEYLETPVRNLGAMEKGLSFRCLFMPCTPVKASELDQAFGLFAALSLFLYEFGPLSLRYLKSFWPHLKRLLGLKQSP